MSEAPDVDKATRIRRLWPNEAHDFTPWLAENLHLLGDRLGLKLKCVKVEQPVGPYSLDILAETDTGSKVAIENQLDWTDFQHLAQTLIYSSGLNVKVAIWVAPEFRYESAKALHWLNCWTRDGLDLYGVKFEVGVTRDDTKFIAVVSPGGWNKDITQPLSAPNPPTQQFDHFFQPLITDLRKAGFAGGPIKRFGPSGRHFPSPVNDGIWYAASLEGTNDAWVTLHIETDEKEQTKRIFNVLKEQKGQIQECLAGEWHWRRHDSQTYSSINFRKDGSIHDSEEELEETRAWMLCTLPKLKQVFEQRVADLLRELPE